MGQFRYRAVNPEGVILESTMPATSRKEALRQLKSQRLVPLEVSESAKPKKTKSKISTKPLKPKVLLQFTKQLHTLMVAGIPLVQGLEVLQGQNPDPTLQPILADIVRHISAGESLSDCLGRYGRAFPSMFLNSIKVGELSGTLEQSLANLVVYVEKDAEVRNQIKKAIRYPITVVIAMIGAFVLFVTYVIPKFAPLFAMSDKELPLPTRILLGTSDILQAYGVLIAFIIVALGLGVFYSRRTELGKRIQDRLVLGIPIFGDLLQKISISRFAKIFYTTSSSGIPVLTSFEVMQTAMGNVVYEDEIQKITAQVKQGKSIAHALERSPWFPPFVVEMVSVGEQSGALDEMLNSVSTYYDLEVSEKTQKITSSIEPVVTVVLGLMAVLMAMAIFLPLWDLMSVGR